MCLNFSFIRKVIEGRQRGDQRLVLKYLNELKSEQKSVQPIKPLVIQSFVSKNFNNLLRNGLHIKRIKEKSFISCHTFQTRKQVASRKSVRLSRDTFSPDNGQMRFLSTDLRKPFQTFTVKLTTRERMAEEKKKTRSIKSHFSCSPKAEAKLVTVIWNLKSHFWPYETNINPIWFHSNLILRQLCKWKLTTQNEELEERKKYKCSSSSAYNFAST